MKKSADMNLKLANILTLVLITLVRVDGSKEERFLATAIPQTLVTLVMTVARVGGRQERYPAVNPQTISRPNYGRPPPYGRPVGGRPGGVLSNSGANHFLYQEAREEGEEEVGTSLAASCRASSSTSSMQSSSGLGL